jgi:hypothetical protein
MIDQAQRERIYASRLFDPQFYRQTYGHLLSESDDPLEHFLSTGLAKGLLPSRQFDPALYRLLVPGCGDANPLLHCLTSDAPFEPPALTALFPAAASKLPAVKGSPDLQLEQNRAYARKAMDIRELRFIAEGRQYTLRIPEREFLRERFSADRPFAFARLPHSFWDTLWQVDLARQGLQHDPRTAVLSDAQRDALALRLCQARYGDGDKFDNNGDFAPQFLEEVLAGIPLHAADPDFMRSVAFLGYPTYRQIAIGSQDNPRGAALRRLFAARFGHGETLYDAMWPKRMLISGQLGELPALCRGRPVILVTSSTFHDLNVRWRLEDFTHVVIPPRLTQWQRWDLLARTLDAVEQARARGGRRPVVLTRCGGELAYWLFTRTFARQRDAFYIDLGQVLEGWYFDSPDLRFYRWSKVYARAVIENCRLEPYYRSLKGPDYDRWFAGLP